MRKLFTIGYEGSQIHELVETLSILGITVLADVRELPLSRKKGFSKNKLAEELRKVGIRYVHYKNLGDPKPGRDAAKAGRIQEFHTIFKKHFSKPHAQAAFAELLEETETETVCMLCFERCATDCHRSFIADAAVSDSIEVLNIIADNPKKYIGNEKDIPRYNPRQSLAAAE